jgi:hypothetical protein
MDRTLERAAGTLNELFDSDPFDPVSFAETAGAASEIATGNKSARMTGLAGLQASTLGIYLQNGE